MSREFVFVRWYDPYHMFAVFRDVETGIEFLVPRSRLIPHPLCEAEVTAKGIHDPNLVADICAERSSVFGIAIFRHFLHLMKKGNYFATDEEELEKAYPFPDTVNFSCVRNCILEGKDTDICIADCS